MTTEINREPGQPLVLLKTKRFLPLLVTLVLGALNDNFFKNALVILILYRLAERASIDGQVLIPLAAGIFILPFFLFSATAGQLADRFDKARLIRAVKLAEIAIMAFAAYGFLTRNHVLLLTALFLMGAQSAFFGPVKYAILPDHLAPGELITGNAIIEAATFLAILLGTIAGGLLILADGGIELVSTLVVLIAVAGYVASWLVPPAEVASPNLRIDPNILRQTWAVMGMTTEHREVFLSVLGISWFWAAGATFLAQFPAFGKNVLGGDEQVVTVLLTVFSVGIALGSLICGRLLRGEITAKYVPLGALGMAVFTLDLFLASRVLEPMSGELSSASAFLADARNWRVLADLSLISGFGGLYIVPLYAIMQARSEEKHRARTIAGNNILNALFIVVAALATAGMLALGLSVTDVFLVIALASFGVAFYICKLLPRQLIKAMAAVLFRLAYRVEVVGVENAQRAKSGAVAVVNHLSFLDGALLAAFLPGDPLFAIDTQIARRWWMRPLLLLVDAFPLDPTSPLATKSLIKAVKSGRNCVIFPEGRITVTGGLMKVYAGPGMIADKAQAPILPVQIEGAQFTHFSRLKGKLRRRLFPKIRLTIFEPRRFDVPAEVRGRERREFVGTRLYELMSDMIYASQNQSQTLFEALLDARSRHGGKSVILDDAQQQRLSYDALVLASLLLGRSLNRGTRRGDAVGLLLPNSAATVVSFFALQAGGRVPAMLNYTSGAGGMLSACRTAAVRRIVSSRRFVEQAKLQDAVAALSTETSVFYLEDLQAKSGLFGHLIGVLSRPFVRMLHSRGGAAPEDPAFILFTSGSEGTPKGVVLSHRNILANCHQLAARVDFTPADLVFNALPVFHAFGLTGGTILPLISGTRSFLYPSPLHYRNVAELIYASNATILFGTDTFLSGYARVAHPYDFHGLRYVFAGAERLREETRQTWMHNFGKRILEGYGTTECAPVIAVNTPMRYRAGSVGRLLPGLQYRLEAVPGIEAGGRLMVSGPNVMLGYLLAERPGELVPPPDGWYDTGDIVTIDQDGFLHIQGRAKRFIKIAGEMVSLAAVESMASRLWPGNLSAAVVLPDSRRGEQLVLVTDRADAGRDEVLAQAKVDGLPELMVPKQVLSVEALPLLGSGKIDYSATRELARAGLPDAALLAGSDCQV